MTRLSKARLHQKAVYWAADGHDDYGDVKVAAPVNINVRWEERQSEVLDSDGNTIRIDAVVVVDREMAAGGILWLGEEADLPDSPTNLKQVVIYSTIPDVKGREFRRVVKLIKYSNELPILSS